MITINRNISYTDTRENMEFWARAKGWTPETVLARHPMTDEPTEVIQNDLAEFINNYFDTLIERELTEPIKQEVEQVAERQIRAEAEALKEDLQEQKVAEVLSRLTIE